jgi:hypothetical protein
MNGLPKNRWQAHTFMPVLQAIHGNTSTLMDFCDAQARGWPGLNEKGF